MWSILKRLANIRSHDSLVNRLRRRRFTLFKSLLSSLPRPLKILDAGGTINFWDMMDFRPEEGTEIYIYNLTKDQKQSNGYICVEGNAVDMSQYRNGEFDLVFSNSVIEHVGNYDDQKRMADEIIRVGKRYFLQTPNYYFPLEPHFLFPFFQYFPIPFKLFLVLHLRAFRGKKILDKTKALNLIKSINLLTFKKLKRLFPEATIYRERMLGLTKSLTAVGGWNH